MKDYIIRKATLAERPQIESLIELSARFLSRHDYSEAQIEAAIAHVFGVDTDLIRDGSYFVAEASGGLVACGGWSKRRNLFGGDRYQKREAGELDPNSEPAKIRAFFVHPDWARKGIAKAILSLCEGEAAACGFRSVELMATLPGVRLYRACGYEEGEVVKHEMGSGIRLSLVPMRKALSEYLPVSEMVTLIDRDFTVNVPLEKAWQHLARVDQWPTWAHHIKHVEVSPSGELGDQSSGVIHLSNGMKSTFRVTEFNLGRNWKWIGPFLWMTIHYDHGFESLSSEQTRLRFVLEANGFGVNVFGRVFARIYRRNLEKAIPLLIKEMEH